MSSQAVAASRGDFHSFELEEVSSIRCVEKYHQRFVTALTSGQKIILSAANVVSVDAAFLQLLAGLFQTAGNRNIVVEWNGVADTLIQGARLANMSFRLDLEQEKS